MGLCVVVVFWVVVNGVVQLLSLIVRTKLPEPVYWTEAVIVSPGLIVLPAITCSGCWSPEEYISHQASYWGTPLITSCSVPICSTVESEKPSIPTQTAE